MCNILLSMFLCYIAMVVAKPVNNFADLEDRIVFPSDLEDRIGFPSEMDDRIVFPSDLENRIDFPSYKEDRIVFPSEIEDLKGFLTDKEDRIVFPSDKEDRTVFPSEKEDPKVFPSDKEDPKVFPSDEEDRIVFPSEIEDLKGFLSDKEDRIVFPSDKEDRTVFPSEKEDPKVFPSDKEDPKVFPSDEEDRIVFPSEIEDPKGFLSDKEDRIVFPSEIDGPKVFPSVNEDRTVFPSHKEDRTDFPSETEDPKVFPSEIKDPKGFPSDIEDHTVFPSKNIINDNKNIKPLKHKEYRGKSAEKCKEYGNYIVYVMPLTNSARPIPITIDCTAASINPLVVDGEIAQTGEFPHMVAIGWLLKDKTIGYYCGGSLVSEQWILTAAHCTHHPIKGQPSVVRLGANRLSDKRSGVILKIESIKRHPRYTPPAMYADLALLKLRKPVSFTPNVKPACLDSQFNRVPTEAWVTGWGATQMDGDPSDLLLKAKLDIVDNINCTLWHNFTTAVPTGVVPSMLCAGDPNGGWKKDTCQGDSGGPLQIIHPNIRCIYSVVGITSFGSLCGTPGYPGVYTRVSHYIEWIESIVWPED